MGFLRTRYRRVPFSTLLVFVFYHDFRVRTEGRKRKIRAYSRASHSLAVRAAAIGTRVQLARVNYTPDRINRFEKSENATNAYTFIVHTCTYPLYERTNEQGPSTVAPRRVWSLLGPTIGADRLRTRYKPVSPPSR